MKGSTSFSWHWLSMETPSVCSNSWWPICGAHCPFMVTYCRWTCELSPNGRLFALEPVSIGVGSPLCSCLEFSPQSWTVKVCFSFFFGCDNQWTLTTSHSPCKLSLIKCPVNVQIASMHTHVFVVPREVLMLPEKRQEGHSDVIERVHQVLIEWHFFICDIVTWMWHDIFLQICPSEPGTFKREVAVLCTFIDGSWNEHVWFWFCSSEKILNILTTNCLASTLNSL